MRTGSPPRARAPARARVPRPPRQGVRPPVFEPREADGGERHASARRALLLRQASYPQGEGDVLFRREHGHELVRLENEPELLAAEPSARALTETRNVTPFEEEAAGRPDRK